MAETIKLLILALETFPGNLNSKELKVSHSFSKETSSELVWLVRKYNQNEKVKQSKSSMFFLPFKTIQKMCPSLLS